MSREKADSEVVFVCRETFFGEDAGGVPVSFHKDRDRVRGDDPILQKHGAYFQRVEDARFRDVEQATAAPGEKRERPAHALPAPPEPGRSAA